MPNEFVIKHGFISKGDSIVNGTISGETLNLTTISSNPSLTQVLVRNNTTGVVEYRDASSLSGGSGTNTFVTGFTYNDNNTFTINDNLGSAFTATINQVSGLTVNGTLSATTLDGNTILSGGTNLITIIDDRDDFVTGTTFGGNQAILRRNDGTDVFLLSGSSSVQLTNPSSNKIDIDVTIPPGMNTYVTGFTYDDINTFTITDNLGTAFTASINVLSATTISATTFYGDGSNLTGIPHTTDTFVSGGTYSDSTDIITFTNTTGGTFNVTGVTDKFVTGGTYNPSTVNLDFSGNSGFSSFSVDVSDLKDDTNTFVTGYTYDNNNTFTISDNLGSAFTATINQVSGLTVNGDITVTGTSNLNVVTATTVDFDLNYTGTTAEGRLSWNSTDATLDLGMGGGNVTQQIGQEIYYRVKNQSGATISNGRVVRNAGSVGASGRILGEYMIADGTYPFAKTLGIATEDILNGSDGLVTEFGVVRGLNTTGSLYGESWSDGDVLYVSSTIPGGLTNVEPQAPNQILEMGVVIFSNVGNGSIFVDRHLSTKLGDISDVQTTGVTNGDLIVYNSATTVWDYSKTLTGDYGINGSLSATTLDGNTIFSGGTNLLTIIEGLDTYVTGGTINLPATDDTNSATIGLLYKNSDGTPRTLPFEDTYTTGSTYDNGTALATFNKNDGTNYTLDLSTIDVNDTFVTGTTFGSNQAILRRNDGVDVLILTGGTNVTLSNPSTNQIKFDVNIPSGSNTFVTGFTYDDINTFTISDNMGSAFTASINVLSATTISATTYYGDGSNLTGVLAGNPNVRNISTTQSVLTTDGTLNCTGGTITLTLPTAVGVTGKEYIIKNSGASSEITVDTTSSQTIDGSTSILIKRQYLSRRLQSNGSSWIVI